MQFNRIINIKPGSMNKVLEIAPKFRHLAEKILGEKYKGPIKVMVRLHGPLGQIKWQWENDSMDEDVQNAMTFAQNEEWNKLVEEMSPYIESSSIGDVIWAEIASV